MQRNSSFFWASDALRELDLESADDGNDVGLALEGGDEAALPRDAASFQGGEEAAIEFTNIERAPLVTIRENYGTSGSSVNQQESTRVVEPAGNDVREPLRRNLFKHQYVKVTNETGDAEMQSIRLQVVIWYIGQVDVQLGSVPMRFRITLFWNDRKSDQNKVRKDHHDKSVWVMQGRQKACRKDMTEDVVKETVDVPPVSILNAVKFETVGSAEIAMIEETTRLMRWTCMYSATLFQADHMRVDMFPHDSHDLKLKIGILANRGRGGRWDHDIYRLDLATEEDSQGSTRIPHGLVVDHAHVPDFSFDPHQLAFEFKPLLYGAGDRARARDHFLQVTLPVIRQSAHYDKSIMPILTLLNVVAISCLPRNFDSATASTETMLSIAFVEVGIRLTIDSRLPSVGYQIKMQKVLNHCFWLLCGLVLESNVVFFLVTKRGWEIVETDSIDIVAATFAMIYTIYILILYYWGKPDVADKPKAE